MLMVTDFTIEEKSMNNRNLIVVGNRFASSWALYLVSALFIFSFSLNTRYDGTAD